MRETRGEPDPRIAQFDRLKEEVVQLRERISRMNQELADRDEFRAMALSRPAAQHEEIISPGRQLHEAARGGLRVAPSG
ncbi:hypothetical protein GCM10022206_44960 [Streptomyces chiangmaiensis]